MVSAMSHEKTTKLNQDRQSSITDLKPYYAWELCLRRC